MKKKNVIIKLVSAAVLTALTAAFLTGCSSAYTDEQIKSEAKSLVEASAEVNKIFFGEGLPAADKDSAASQSFAEANEVELENVAYLPVSPDCGYKTKDDVMQAAKDVYSASYCTYLEQIAFTGVSDEDTGSAVFARYIEDTDGNITVKNNLSETGMKLNRTYDTDNIEVVKNTKKQIKIKVQSYVDGEKDEALEFVLTDENGTLRLDTPTY